MKKKMKVLVGLCLAAVLALGGVGRYAQAETGYLRMYDSDNVLHTIECSSSIGQTSGSAHTSPVGSSICHCSVDATFTWKDSNGNVLYSNGRGSGGMHGAGVSMSFVGDTSMVYSSVANALHTVNFTSGGYGNGSTSHNWSR